MALTQRLEIRQSHALVMTPQLMQAIKLLQLSNLDLAAYVENELEKNPLLERSGEEADTATAGETESQQKPDSSDWSDANGRAEALDPPEGTTMARSAGLGIMPTRLKRLRCYDRNNPHPTHANAA